MNQAKKGGERGLNGEWYEGGQFLPGSEKTVKGANKHEFKPPTGKQCIAPYVWEKAPKDGLLAIYARIQSHSAYANQDECEYILGQGIVGLQLKPWKSTRTHPKIFDNKEDIPAGAWAYGRKWRRNPETGENEPHGWLACWKDGGDYVREEPEEVAPFFILLISRWNAGERWYKLEEDPYHYANQNELGENYD